MATFKCIQNQSRFYLVLAVSALTIWPAGSTGAAETLVLPQGLGNGFVCLGTTDLATIEGFQIVGGHYSGWPEYDGGGVSAYSASATLRDCIIRQCTGQLAGGILAVHSYLEVERCTVSECTANIGSGAIAVYGYEVSVTDCEIIANQGGSIGAGGFDISAQSATIASCRIAGNASICGDAGGIWSECPALRIEDCLLFLNRSYNSYSGGGSGVRLRNSSAIMIGCTLAGNFGFPYVSNAISLAQTELQMERVIVAFNGGMPVGCQSSTVEEHCCNIFGNETGDDIDCGVDAGGNFSVDPLFCGLENDDFTLDCRSPCLPGNHPDGIDCGLIGALGQGCGTTSVEETSWGRVKSLYRKP